MISHDRELLGACLSGEKAAWDVLIRRYSRLVYHTIKNTLRRYGHSTPADVVEDLYQEFFLSLLRNDFKKLRQFKGKKGCTLASWLRVVASRVTIDFLRRQSIPAADVLEVLPVSQADSSDILVEQEEKRLVSRAIELLSGRDQILIALCHQQALSPQMVASILGTSVGGVYTQKSRVIRKLRRALRKSYAL